MGRDDDDERDDDERDAGKASAFAVDPTRELDEVLGDLEGLLKNGDVVEALTKRNINSSLALVAIHALRSYLEGDKAAAAEDFSTVGEEIAARLAQSRGAHN